jgi:hypothetical protein
MYIVTVSRSVSCKLSFFFRGIDRHPEKVPPDLHLDFDLINCERRSVLFQWLMGQRIRRANHCAASYEASSKNEGLCSLSKRTQDTAM